jgi:ribosomal protein S18 acetylase RimI-like enzyme
MNSQVHLGPGSDLPLWIEALDRTCFGKPWGCLDDQEHVWAIEHQAFARWKVVPEIGEAELLRIAVLSEARGKGMGRALLRTSEEQVRAMGCPVLLLEVRTSNTAARKLYVSEGWEECGLRRGYYRDGEDAVLFRKQLS